MKNKIFGGFAMLAIVAVAAFNVNLGSKSNNVPDISLKGIEAKADWSEWWNSKEHTCESRDCSYTYTLVFWSATYYGTYNNCITGTSYAHCWECDSACNAY